MKRPNKGQHYKVNEIQRNGGIYKKRVLQKGRYMERLNLYIDQLEKELQSERIKALSQAEQADELKNLRTIIGTYYPHIIDGINEHISNLKKQ